MALRSAVAMCRQCAMTFVRACASWQAWSTFAHSALYPGVTCRHTAGFPRLSFPRYTAYFQ
eukprot:8951756-Pyramimonas_sp.AAC.1